MLPVANFYGAIRPTSPYWSFFPTFWGTNSTDGHRRSVQVEGQGLPAAAAVITWVSMYGDQLWYVCYGRPVHKGGNNHRRPTPQSPCRLHKYCSTRDMTSSKLRLTTCLSFGVWLGANSPMVVNEARPSVQSRMLVVHKSSQNNNSTRPPTASAIIMNTR